jgi:Morc6 ribosomal protein S5 domain 2-like
MILRDKEIEQHNIVNDMMLKQNVTYRPQSADGAPKDPNVMKKSFCISSEITRASSIVCLLLFFLGCVIRWLQ